MDEGRLVRQDYEKFSRSIASLLEEARRRAARSVNAILTATHWEVGRRIVEFEQGGKRRAEYGEELLARLARDLTARFGKGFSLRNLRNIRAFYLHWPIRQTLSAEFKAPKSDSILAESLSPTASKIHQAASGKSAGHDSLLEKLAERFPLSWSHYARLLMVRNEQARSFYEAEALRGGWTVRQLDRQVESQFYERTALSRNKTAMLTKGMRPRPEDRVTVEDEIKDPYVLEFLGLKDEYSETDMEEALVRHLEDFLLELGGDFAFIGRQRRLRVGNEWYRVDLVFYHRRLRCLVLVDLKLGRFAHTDVGQMHLYLNYARHHWTRADENPPVGVILCAFKDAAVARYALEGLPNKVLATEYRTALPAPERIEREIIDTRRALEKRAFSGRMKKK
jgi:predicted nuclease of restriction endonuclease-like (RecB) superfamily